MAECMHRACMAILTIRNLPDVVNERLKEQAKRNRRSLNQEVIAELLERQDSEVVERERYVNQMIAGSEAVYAAVNKPMTTEEIRRSTEGGRD
ncbi:MAG: Arc family DNA-binding protein [Puniceicoccaceae bacterium]|nr:MAG: Arc family DNA-binding protein [Puniceicoccaceae bacterium]